MSSPLEENSVRGLLKRGIEQLRAAQVPSYTLAAELLLIHVVARDRTWLYAHPEEMPSPESAAKYFALLERRASGEPTQHLTGKQEFWGLEFEVTPDVLIPRPETEHLIEVALDRLAVREIRAGRAPQLKGEDVTMVDLGTGSGCIAIALAKELPAAAIFATDISRPALEVARRNAARLGFANRVHFVQSNLLEAFGPDSVAVQHVAPQHGKVMTDDHPSHQSQITSQQSPLFDLIISNPPYVSWRESEVLPIEVRQHEPHEALFGGEEGYELYGALIPQAAQHLKPGGLLVLELGYNSLAAVEPLLETSTWTNIAVTNDLAGIPRVLSAELID
jgi:release factor glutamine methyltransferase